MKHKMKTRSIIVRCGSGQMLPFAIVFGLDVVLFGTISPGGGFQGGVIVASAALLLTLGYGYRTAHDALHPHFLHAGEAFGAIVYVALALIGLLCGANFCRNIFWDNGAPGELISAGTITFMSWTVGFKVLTGVAFLLLLLLGLMAPGSDGEEDDET